MKVSEITRSREDPVKKQRLEPNSPEAVKAIVRRIESMTKEELQGWIDKLSHAPEGVYDPWSEENWPLEKALRHPTNGRTPATEPPLPEAEHTAGSD
jgi:hypothetical protein